MPHKEANSTDLKLLKPLLQRDTTLPGKISFDSWLAHEEIRAGKVAEYRRFADGDHDVELSQEMKDALRTDTLTLNHCENILETLSDRLRLSGVQVSVSNEAGDPDEAASDEANKWVETLTSQWNRLDGMQIGLHDAIPRDGMSYMMAEYSAEKGRVIWTHEEAFDGHSGVIVVWGDDGQSPTLAIKLWHETLPDSKKKLVDHVRINLYFPDRIEKYIAAGNKLNAFADEDGESDFAWVMADGSPIGVPVIPFVYKGKQYNKHGLGRLENVVAPQRSVNRGLMSLIMASENLGFPIRYLLGAAFPKKIRPGTTIEIKIPDKVATTNGGERDATAAERSQIMDGIAKIKLGQLEAAPLGGLLDELDKLILQMYIVSGTPYPEGAGANISGEALKQLDIRLVGTANRCQTGWGNSWEDLINLSARIEAVFAGGAPWPLDQGMVVAKWESAEVRDDAVIIGNVKSTFEIIEELDVRTRLEMLAPVHGWDKARIDEIEGRIKDALADAQERELNVNGNGGFNEFGNGTTLDDPFNPSLNPSPQAERDLQTVG